LIIISLDFTDENMEISITICFVEKIDALEVKDVWNYSY